MAGKTRDLVRELRQDIVDGRYAPGERIPSQIELAERFDVAGMTVQMAVKHLEREGFIEARGPLGTFVTEPPPHLNSYAVVFVFDPVAPFAEQNWSRYHQALTQASIRLQQATGKRMLMFHGIDQHADSEDRQSLIAHIERQSLAGIVFTNPPLLLAGTPILDAPGIPRVALMSHPDTRFPQVSIVSFDGVMWVDKALDHLAALGRRRVAIIEFGTGPEFDARVQARLEARGMVSHRRWRQFVSLRNAKGATNAVELLMNDRERPDSLLVEDDNFVEQAVAGLAAAGVRVPDDVAVVGHANFPVAPSKLLPMRLLGYDANLFLRTAVDLIDRQRRGEKVPQETKLPALWEEEVGSQCSVFGVQCSGKLEFRAAQVEQQEKDT